MALNMDTSEDEARAALYEGLLRRKRMEDPAYQDSMRRSAELGAKTAEDNNLAALLMSSAAKAGAIGGRVADATPVGDYAKQANANQAQFQDQLGQRQSDAEKRFGMNAKVYEYIADRNQKKQDTELANELRKDSIASTAKSRADELAFKNKALEQEKEIAGAKIAAESKSKTPTDYEGKLSKLNETSKARFDNVRWGLTSVNNMIAALNKGGSRFSLIGDNDFTTNLNIFNEAIGRMQSGGAIGVEEAKNFKNLARGLADSPKTAKQKLQILQNEMVSRFKTLGFTPEEVTDPGLRESYSKLAQKPKAAAEDGTAIAGPSANSQASAAEKWARENPTDPRSAEILKRLGVQ